MNTLPNQDITKMRREIEEIPIAVQRLLDKSRAAISDAAEAVRQLNPRFATTIARGSSDHAAAYLKYAFELTSGIPVASLGPSIASVYKAPLKLEGGVSIAISQSGASPDIVAMAQAARAGGALSIAITNNPQSPLGAASAHCIDIQAGVEASVAATKTFVTSIIAGLQLLGSWRRDTALLDAIARFPEQARAAIECDWSMLSDRLRLEDSMLVLGRGPAMAIASEAALKFKETCQIHAEAYSSAEVMHGPVSIVGAGFPVLALIARDAAEQNISAMAERLAAQGADVFGTSASLQKPRRLPFAASGHSLTDPLLLIISFYAFIEELARRRGLDPDVPPNLRKVTETV